jgi:hypothetical protein
MPYANNPAGLGVGKRYGALNLGGVAGVTYGANGELRWVVEISSTEKAANDYITMKLPDGYARITACWVEVETAFGTGDTVDVLYNGVTILAAPLAVSALGVVVGTLAVTAATGDVAFTIDDTLEDAGDLDGRAKIVVVLERI